MSDLLLNAITSERYKAIFSSSLMLGIIGLSFGFLAMFFGTIILPCRIQMNLQITIS